MRKPRNSNLLHYARDLRINMTREERYLWFDFLRYCIPRFRRQQIIGNYIADFYCDQARMVIELDGSQHLDDAGLKYDAARSAYFRSLGIRVIRYYNTDIHNNFKGVCDHILGLLKAEGFQPTLHFGD